MTQSSQRPQPRIAVGYSANNWTCALSVLRLVGPLRACGMQFIEGNENVTVYPERVSLADIVIIQRDFPRFCKEYDEVLQRARDEGKPVIFDIDDLIFELPADHPDQVTGYYDYSLLGMLRAVVEADAVTVSTPALRAYYQSFNANTWVLPNYINEQVWKLDAVDDAGNADCDDGSQGVVVAVDRMPVVIGFIGGDSHEPDIASIAPMLRQLAVLYGNRIALLFLGIKPPASVADLADLCSVKWMPMDSADYSRFATLFKCNKPDIAIAPLTDTPFNRCKSAIKFLEYSALALPGVYSALTPYVDKVVHAQNGFLAHTQDEWLAYLCALIDDPALRAKIGAAALTTAKEHWSLGQHAHEWLDMYAQLVKQHTVSPLATPVRRSVRQMQTWQQQARRSSDETTILVDKLAVERQTNAHLLQELSQARENARLLQGQLAEQKHLATQQTTLSDLRAQLERSDEKNAIALWHLSEQAQRANIMRERFGQLDAHIGALTACVTYQNKVINGMLNGRIMRTIIAAQVWIKNLLRSQVTPQIKPPQNPPMPVLIEPSAPVHWHAPFEVNLEIIAVAGRENKQMLTRLFHDVLSGFIASGQAMQFPKYDAPIVTIIVPLYNRAELTLQCLRSIPSAISTPYEIIIVDDCSSDDTQVLLNCVTGATIIRNETNLHFLRSCNLAAKRARGQYLLFLNNDVQLFPGAIDAALSTIFEPDTSIGAVGARIILLDGTLQEAGSIVWSDGSCLGYGRGDDPNAPPYMFKRDVDYCSGAFLLTPRALFEQVGGFDDRFAPAYYEDSDYCLTIKNLGNRVVYDPAVTILHYETASYQGEKNHNPMQLQERNRNKLLQKHAQRLKQHYASANPAHALFARAPIDDRRKRILFIDDRVPHRSAGSGFPRSRELLLTLVETGLQVTFYPLTTPIEPLDKVYQEMPRSVEVMTGYGVAKLEQFLEARRGYYDTILVSRPHNARTLNQILTRHHDWFAHTRIIFDAEAIYAFRNVAQRRLKGEDVPDSVLAAEIKEEVDLAIGMDAIVCVSESERSHFTAADYTRVYTLGHCIEPDPTPNGFAERHGILFVGAMDDDLSPNTDSVVWFTQEILPRVRQQLGADAILTIVGSNGSARIRRLAGAGVQVTGRVDDLNPCYNQARIFVAPTRYAAGIPMKVHHAAAHGIPIVCTSLLAKEVGWLDGVDVLVGDDPATLAAQCVKLYTDQVLWSTLRSNALKRIEHECSPAIFRSVIRQILAENS